MPTPDINEILAQPAHLGCSRYGAQMGRASQGDGNPERLYLQRLRLVDGGCYDTGGAYWGQRPEGEVLYCAFSPERTKNVVPIRIFVVARGLEEAKQKVLARLEGEGWKFFR